MNELKERLEIEKQGWIENYMKKQVQILTMHEPSISQDNTSIHYPPPSLPEITRSRNSQSSFKM